MPFVKRVFESEGYTIEQLAQDASKQELVIPSLVVEPAGPTPLVEALGTVHVRTPSVLFNLRLAIRAHVDLYLVKVIVDQVCVALLPRVRLGPTLNACFPKTCLALHVLAFLLHHLAAVWVAAEHQGFVI